MAPGTCQVCGTVQELDKRLVATHPMPTDETGRIVVRGTILWGVGEYNRTRCGGSGLRSEEQREIELARARARRRDDAKKLGEDAKVANDAYLENAGRPRREWTRPDIMEQIEWLLRHALVLYRAQYSTPAARCGVASIWRPVPRDDGKRDVFCTFCGLLIRTVAGSTRVLAAADVIRWAVKEPAREIYEPRQTEWEAADVRVHGKGYELAQRAYWSRAVIADVADHAIPCGLQYLAGMIESVAPGVHKLPEDPDPDEVPWLTPNNEGSD